MFKISTGNKKILALLVSVSLFFNLVFVSFVSVNAEENASTPVNLVKNPGFEDATEIGLTATEKNPWYTWAANASIKNTIIGDVVKSGKLSAKTDSPVSGTSIFRQNLDVNALRGKTVKVSGYIKTQDIKSTGTAVNIWLFCLDKNGGQLPTTTTVLTKPLTGTNDWAYYEKIVTIPNDLAIDGISVRLQASGSTGFAWFDDISVTEYNAVTDLKLPASYGTLKLGETQKLVPEILPSNATVKQLTWASKDETIAKVDQTGLVTPLKEGYTRIVATSVDGISISYLVYVISGAAVVPLQPENSNVSTKKNQSLQGAMKTTADGNTLKYETFDNPLKGIVRVSVDGKWTYYPNKDYSGADRFSALVFNGKGGVAVNTVNVTIDKVNSEPILNDYMLMTKEKKTTWFSS